MANSIQEIRNIIQALKDLSTQAEAAKTPLRILSGTLESAVSSGDVDKINTATKAVQTFYSALEAGKTKTAVNLRNLVDTQGLLNDLQKVKAELQTIATTTALKGIGVTPTQASKIVAASEQRIDYPGDQAPAKTIKFTQAEIAQFAGVKSPAQVRKVLDTIQNLVDSGLEVTLPALSKTAVAQMSRLSSGKVEAHIQQWQSQLNAKQQELLQAEIDQQMDERSKLRNAIWQGPTEKQPFAPNSVMRQARRDFEAEMEARAQPFVQSNPAFQVTPGDEAKSTKQAAAEREKLNQIEQQQQKLLESHIQARQKEIEALKKLGEESISAYEKQGVKFANKQADQDLAEQERLRNLGESTLDDYERQGAKFANQQAERELKLQEQITKEREKQARIDREHAKLLQAEIDKRIHDPRQPVGTQTADMTADIQNDPVYKAELDKQRQEQLAQINRQFRQQVDAFRTQQAQQNLQDNPYQAVSQAFGGNIQQINALRERLKGLNLDTGTVANGFGNLKRVSTEASTGVSALSFSMTDASGVTREASMHVDRFGRILQDTSGRFQNFGDLIGRNTVKVLEWAVSLTLVYGSIQKVTQLAEAMTRLQQQMVEIGITTGQTGKYLTGLFDEVKKIADVTASDFGTGIESLNTALRASSGIADQSERSATALGLLKDAMTLAKLASIDNAQAMDYLVAGLRQMDLALTEGSKLLDVFQAVSQRANTSVQDMAATFAITAGSAQDVQVDMYQLAGLIGAFSEATTLSATETGNALRAMFSNFTQPQAIEVLNKYGIAVKNLDGTFRSFVDVFKQASELARSGILNDRQVAELSNALGGGSRRQAQVSALLTVEPRFEALTDVAKYNSAGAAQDALKLKTDTLKSATELLQNSFDNLAISLGSDGAFLDHLTGAVKLLTSLLDVINTLTEALGPSTSTLIGYGVAMAALAKYGPELRNALGIGNIFSGFGQGKGLTGNLNIPTTIDNGPGIAPTVLTKGEIWVQAGKNFGGAAVPVILSAISQLGAGNTSGAIGTAIGGGLIAAISGNPAWAIIGSVIGQAAADAIQRTIAQNAAFEKAVQGTISPLTGNETPEQIQKLREQYQQNFLNLSGEAPITTATQRDFGSGALRFLAGVGNTVLSPLGMGQSSSEQLLHAVQAYEKSLAAGRNGTELSGVERLGFTLDVVQKAKAYLDVLKEIQKISKEKVETGTIINPNLQGYKSFQTVTEQMKIEFDRQKSFDLINQLQSGQINKGEYKSILSNALPGSGNRATSAIIALNPELQTATEEGVKPFIAQWQKLNETLSQAPDELLTFLDETVSSISELNTKIGASKATLEGFKTAASLGIAIEPEKIKETSAALAENNRLLEVKKSEYQAILTLIEKAKTSEFKFAGFEDVSKDLSNSDIERLRQRALKLQESYGLQKLIPMSTLTEFANNNPFTLFSKEGTFQEPKDVIHDFWNWAVEEEKRAKQEMDNAWNFQNLRNIEISQKGRLQQAINYYTNLLKQWGFNEKNELITVLFKDNQVGQLIGSQTALQLALQDLTEVEKKQLDGVYNLPSGATAYIPLSAGQMLSNYSANQALGSKIDYGNFPTPILQQGNGLLSQINTGIQKLVAMGGMFATNKVPEFKDESLKIKSEILNEQPKTYVDAQNLLYDKIKASIGFEPTKNQEQSLQALTNKSAADQTQLVSAITSGILARIPKISGGEGLNAGGGFGSNPARTPANSFDIKITPAKIESTYNTTTTIRLDGRVLWSAIKKYAFEDYARFTSSVGSNGRSRTNVL